MATELLTESFQMNRDGIVVDRAKGTISGVRLCGEKSTKGYRYRGGQNGIFKNGSLYEGVRSFYGHTPKGEEDQFEKLIAKVSNVSLDHEGFPRGTLSRLI